MFRRDRLGPPRTTQQRLEHVERHVLEMLDVDRHTLDLATSGLLRSANPQALRSAVSDSDHGVNLHAFTDDLHTAVHQLLVADLGVSDGAAQALSYHCLARIAAQALSYHCLARIAAHLSNILTSIVMPLDKLDYNDGSHATTGSP